MFWWCQGFHGRSECEVWPARPIGVASTPSGAPLLHCSSSMYKQIFRLLRCCPGLAAQCMDRAVCLWCWEQVGGVDEKPGRRGNLLWRTFWGAHQRFFRHMCMAAKVPGLVRMSQVRTLAGLDQALAWQWLELVHEPCSVSLPKRGTGSWDPCTALSQAKKGTQSLPCSCNPMHASVRTFCCACASGAGGAGGGQVRGDRAAVHG